MNTSFSIKRQSQSSSFRRQSGMTLVETLVSASLMVFVSAGLLVLTLEAAKSQSRALVEATMNQEADQLQDRLLNYFRDMSASESVIFSKPVVSGGRMYRSVISAKGESPTFTREEIHFDDNAGRVMQDPDRSDSTAAVVFYRPELNSDYPKLTELYFFASMKVGGIPDGSKLNIYFEMTDDGHAGLNDQQGQPKDFVVARSFAVKMRN